MAVKTQKEIGTSLFGFFVDILYKYSAVINQIYFYSLYNLASYEIWPVQIKIRHFKWRIFRKAENSQFETESAGFVLDGTPSFVLF